MNRPGNDPGSTGTMRQPDLARGAPFWEIEQHSAETIALIGPDGGSWSYGALKNAADQAAGRFPNREHAVAFILFENDPSAVAVYLGALRSRSVVPLLLQRSINPAFLGVLIEIYSPAWVAARCGTRLPEPYSPFFDFDVMLFMSARIRPPDHRLIPTVQFCCRRPGQPARRNWCASPIRGWPTTPRRLSNI